MDWKYSVDRTYEIEEYNIEGKVPMLKFPMLHNIDMIAHGFTTRLGGVSKGDCASMNLSYTRGDDPACVTENFNRCAQTLGFHISDIVCSDQTHTTNIRIMKSEDKGKGIIRERDYHDIDGMITNEKGVVLAAFFADCVPLYFVDPVKKVIGLSHSGWKGTAGWIGARTVEAMTREYGSNPADIVAAIGPSICRSCYEVSEDVIEAFQTHFTVEEMEQIADKKANGKYQLDLWEANYKILQHAGIRKDHIARTDICTCCNKDLLFSHRATMGKRGNLAAFLTIKNDKE